MKRSILERMAETDFESHRWYLEYSVTSTNVRQLWPLVLISCCSYLYGVLFVLVVVLAGTAVAWLYGLGVVIVEDSLSDPRQPRYWLVAGGQRSEIPYQHVKWCRKQAEMVTLTNG